MTFKYLGTLLEGKECVEGRWCACGKEVIGQREHSQLVHCIFSTNSRYVFYARHSEKSESTNPVLDKL
jgi:hypothetical protein